MIITDPQDTLLMAQVRANRLHGEAAAERFSASTAKRRRAVAELLRRAANRLDPAPLAVAERYFSPS
jgi:hypothetical protein